MRQWEKDTSVKESPYLQKFPQLNAFHGKPGFISLVGHRGARGLMPENTIEGFEYILDNGISAIEFDVLLTKDEVKGLIQNIKSYKMRENILIG